jgi:hypothetical protein
VELGRPFPQAYPRAKRFGLIAMTCKPWRWA